MTDTGPGGPGRRAFPRGAGPLPAGHRL